MHKLTIARKNDLHARNYISEPLVTPLSMPGSDNAPLGATTLRLIHSVLKHISSPQGKHASQLNKRFQHWQQILESSLSDHHLQKALRVAATLWIEAKIALSRQEANAVQKAKDLTKHLNLCVAIFDLESEPEAIKTLHYFLVHSLPNLPKPIECAQRKLYLLTASRYHKTQNTPSYHKITNRLLVNRISKPSIRSFCPSSVVIGLLGGLAGAFMVSSYLHGLCAL
jgi:hypothetical protein